MTDPGDGAFTAFRVGDRLKKLAQPPWEVFGERIRRYELHLNGARVEMIRAPVELEGYGLRLFRAADDQMGVGVAASTDLRDAGVDLALRDAEATARFARFPTRRVDLPSTAARSASVEVMDRDLWDHPLETLQRFVDALLRPFDGRKDVQPSFGSVRANLVDTTITNSEGLHRRFSHTLLEHEFAVKATGGPEGAPPGEFWVNGAARRPPIEHRVAVDVERWCRLAEDTRAGRSPATGPTRVVLTPEVLADILPAIVGFRMSGTARLRKMAPEPGATLGSPSVTILDDGLLPFGVGTAPSDDEGTTPSRRSLIEGGIARGGLYDLLHGGAFGEGSTGSGRRDAVQFPNWFHFSQSVGPRPTTIILSAGTGGTETELLEACGEGLLIEQLGYAFPDPVSGAFGGEIRSAYRIHQGRRAEPIRGGTLGGVVFAPPGSPSLLASIEAIGRQPELVGHLSSPAVVVDGMIIAGS
ncbi:MAG TPA: TldD/PmbA family protein [Thermoplasmata archaeon]|nr:TldD/PmbA family protein [Thermoplasmata archaeon]